MIVKFFANRGGGSPKASIDYLLGKDRNREGAEVLKGDPELSLAIAESLEFKNNYTVGCLSFEESEIDLSVKKEVMEKFEEMIFAGLEKDQYNITWIEHSDKGRVELNFFIPNVELTTQKRLQPYYDRVDRPMVDCFKKVINHEYGFTNPDLLEKRQLSKQNSYSPKTTKELKEIVAKFVVDNISNGKITSREQIVDLLKRSDYEVVRTTDKSISIKNPYSENGKNIRFSGEIYEKEFYETIRNTREIGGCHRLTRIRAESEDRDLRTESFGKSNADLRGRIKYRSEQFSKNYQTKNNVEHGTALDHRDIINNLARHGLLVLDDKQRKRENSLSIKYNTDGVKQLTERNTDSEKVRSTAAEDQRISSSNRYGMGGERSVNLYRKQEQGNADGIERKYRVSNDHHNTKVTTEESHSGAVAFYELLERSRNHCQRIRERISGAIRQVRGFESKIREVIGGTRDIKSTAKDREPNLEQVSRTIERYRLYRENADGSKRFIISTEQIINRTELSLRESGKYINESFKQSERINSEFGATVAAVDQKITQKEQKKSRGWSMSR